MLKKPHILVVGSFMMDLVAFARRAPELGETVVGTGFRTAPGGKGANQAVQAARLGARVDMAGCVGTDSFGREMLDAVSSAGVDVSHVKISDAHPSGVGHIEIQANEDGVQNRIIVTPGANYDLLPEDLAWLEAAIGSYDMVIMQLELTMEVTKFVARLAHAAGVPVMLNPAPAAPLDDDLLECVTFLSPNETEAAMLSGVAPDAGGRVGEAKLTEISAALRRRGVPNVIVTLGDQGSAVCAADGIKRTACVKMTNVVDPTAAGDSFVAAFCTGVSAGLPMEQALAFASHTAAITVCGMGAIPSLPRLEEVICLIRERQYAGININELEVLK